MKSKLEKFGKFKVANPAQVKGGIQRYACTIGDITFIVDDFPVGGASCIAIGDIPQ